MSSLVANAVQSLSSSVGRNRETKLTREITTIADYIPTSDDANASRYSVNEFSLVNRRCYLPDGLKPCEHSYQTNNLTSIQGETAIWSVWYPHHNWERFNVKHSFMFSRSAFPTSFQPSKTLWNVCSRSNFDSSDSNSLPGLARPML